MLHTRLTRAPNAELLLHEKKRAIELQCVELEDRMESQGYTEEEIVEKVDAFRTQLLEKQKEDDARELVQRAKQQCVSCQRPGGGAGLAAAGSPRGETEGKREKGSAREMRPAKEDNNARDERKGRDNGKRRHHVSAHAADPTSSPTRFASLLLRGGKMNSHEAARANEEKNSRAREAFGIRRDYSSGQAFDRELQAERKEKRRLVGRQRPWPKRRNASSGLSDQPQPRSRPAAAIVSRNARRSSASTRSAGPSEREGKPGRACLTLLSTLQCPPLTMCTLPPQTASLARRVARGQTPSAQRQRKQRLQQRLQLWLQLRQRVGFGQQLQLR